eukprot:comp12655_c0_seq1/m.7726 comp12655_c0_seq1/g.7726  ORF comp12655_c0_seq1/g.7726 comp12655_c0_seq1/m.7726 type:complete len:537 (-) comp12655_c0_seq1:268-1878(-)
MLSAESLENTDRWKQAGNGGVGMEHATKNGRNLNGSMDVAKQNGILVGENGEFFTLTLTKEEHGTITNGCTRKHGNMDREVALHFKESESDAAESALSSSNGSPKSSSEDEGPEFSCSCQTGNEGGKTASRESEVNGYTHGISVSDYEAVLRRLGEVTDSNEALRWRLQQMERDLQAAREECRRLKVSGKAPIVAPRSSTTDKEFLEGYTTSIFNGQHSDLRHFSDIVCGAGTEAASSRMWFVQLLHKRRGECRVEHDVLLALGQAVWKVLDECVNARDSMPAHCLMVVCFTYYSEQDGVRTYLAHHLKNHVLWRDDEFWDFVMQQGTSQSRRSSFLSVEKAESTSSNDEVAALLNNTRSQLLTLLQHRGELGLSYQSTVRFVESTVADRMEASDTNEIRYWKRWAWDHCTPEEEVKVSIDRVDGHYGLILREVLVRDTCQWDTNASLDKPDTATMPWIIVVKAVVEDSPADCGQIREWDQLVRINGQPIKPNLRVYDVTQEFANCATVDLVFLRWPKSLFPVEPTNTNFFTSLFG